MKYNIDFTAWYLNPSRICQLLDRDTLNEYLATAISHQGRAYIGSDVGIAHTAIKHELERWLHNNPIPSLGELILSKKPLDSGQLFTVYQDFYGKGLSKYNHCRGPLPRDAIAELHNKLKFEDGRRLQILYSPENLISASAWNRLSGRTRLYCIRIMGTVYLLGLWGQYTY